ncbi:MAG: amidohydrolase family protein, partial [bacterium]|nr:amidohydrolase family protein [bacterium]
MKRTKLTPMLLATSLLLASTGLLAQDEAPAQVLFENVRVFDGTSEKLTAKTNVLVEGNLIKAVGSSVRGGAGATVVDGGGGILMPGLIDTHVHFNMNESNLNAIEAARWDRIASVAAGHARDWLMDGFTTVRGM